MALTGCVSGPAGRAVILARICELSEASGLVVDREFRRFAFFDTASEAPTVSAGIPLYTRNGADFRVLERLIDVVEV